MMVSVHCAEGEDWGVLSLIYVHCAHCIIAMIEVVIDIRSFAPWLQSHILNWLAGTTNLKFGQDHRDKSVVDFCDDV